MLDSQITQRSNVEVGTYFVSKSNKLYYVDGMVGIGIYAIENCRSGQTFLWTEEHINSRRKEVIKPSDV